MTDGNLEETINHVLGVCTERRSTKPERDRRALHLRTMPPGFPYRKRQNLLLQVSALLELVPAGVYAICGFRLLEKPEAKD